MSEEVFVSMDSVVSELRSKTKEILRDLSSSDYRITIKVRNLLGAIYVYLIITNKYYSGVHSTLVKEIIERLDPFCVRGTGKGLKFIFTTKELIRRLRRGQPCLKI